MSGKELKEILTKEGVNLSELARLLGFANDQRLHSALKAEDVKSGLIESIARVTNKSIGFFYKNVSGAVALDVLCKRYPDLKNKYETRKQKVIDLIEKQNK